MPGAQFALQDSRQRRHVNDGALFHAGGVDFRSIRCKDELGSTLRHRLAIAFQRARIAIEVL